MKRKKEIKQWKKVLLSSVAALAVFAAAAPVLAEGGVNGGANNPRGPQDTDVASKILWSIWICKCSYSWRIP